ncbi:MAG: PIN domain nuclease, partial [Deltaproteobacteria bacterium]|nr:PIN domain nuclease [Deltaproteobacteria bacterium]
NLSHIRDFLRKVTVLSFDEKAADRFGQVKATLRKSGEIIEDFDILIASIAIVQNAVLVTNNTNHFERIPGLHLENWLKQ